MTDDLAAFWSQWPLPTTVRFGIGRINELGKTAARLGLTNPLVVSDPGLADTPVLPTALDTLDRHGVFTEVKSNPTQANVVNGTAAYRDGGHDGIIAVGGGSAMDAAKAIALHAGHPGDVLDFRVGGPKYKEIDGAKLAPLITVPTTSGTGSEVGYAAVVSDEAANVKHIFYHPQLLARTVICDPALVQGLPANLTAWTGMDALVHCLEAYCTLQFNPLSDGAGAEGLRLIRGNLANSVTDGSDLEARANMMAAAALGAIAFNKGLGAVHAISHAVGARVDSHHGLTNAVVLPYVLAFNRSTIQDKLAPLAGYLGLKGMGFDAIMEWALDLRGGFNIPETLADLGVTDDMVPALAEVAARDITARDNPRPIDAASLEGIIVNAIRGDL